MQLNPYGTDAVLLAVDLVRSPPTTPEELEETCRSSGVVIDRHATKSDLRQVRILIDRWLAVVDATSDQDRADTLNVLLHEHAAYPRLTDHAATGWHVHY